MGNKTNYMTRGMASIRLGKLIVITSLILMVILLRTPIPSIEMKEIPEKSISCNKPGRCYSNPKIKLHGCSVTIVFMEPRISKAPAKSDIYYSLESMAANVIPIDTTCVLIQTAFNCPYISEEDLFNRIKSNALPKLRAMIDMGNVRISSIEDDNIYPIQHCHWNVNRLFMSDVYWSREFHDDDSDNVIIFQADAVFCRVFNASLWTDFAYIGGVWPPKANMHGNPAPPEGVCKAMSGYWSCWHGNIWPFPQIKPTPYPNVCKQGHAPVGNGGFSLRSRKWMIKAIQTCPSPYTTISYSYKSTCNLPFVDYPEDLYFATVLNGINAPMPNAIEAAIFAVEMIFLETTMTYYPHHNHNKDQIMKQRLHDYELYPTQNITVPIGLHKPWWYHEIDFLLSDQMKTQCPYLYHVMPSSLKKDLK